MCHDLHFLFPTFFSPAKADDGQSQAAGEDTRTDEEKRLDEFVKSLKLTKTTGNQTGNDSGFRHFSGDQMLFCLPGIKTFTCLHDRVILDLRDTRVSS